MQQERNFTPYRERRLKTKPALIVFSILLLGNILWFIAWLLPNGASGGSELVAEVGGDVITREQWMAEMETLYGRDILLKLVNAKVMEKAAKKYDISVTEEEIDLELSLIRSAQDGTSQNTVILNEEQEREQIRSELILEKVLTKDVVIKESDIESYYEENKSLYNIPTTRKVSVIVLNSEQDAKEVMSELEAGSAFDALARERSMDSSSAALGGNVGYMTEDQANEQYGSEVFSIQVGKWSEPVTLKGGKYAILFVESEMVGKSFSFNEVQTHIQREIALEQLPQTITPEIFWDEFETKWFYGN